MSKLVTSNKDFYKCPQNPRATNISKYHRLVSSHRRSHEQGPKLRATKAVMAKAVDLGSLPYRFTKVL